MRPITLSPPSAAVLPTVVGSLETLSVATVSTVMGGWRSMNPVLQAAELTKRYASLEAVQDVTFSLLPGQVLGCLGPNGSGKSTTVKMLTGLLEPTRGKVLFCGEDIRNDLVSYRKQLGYVPEEPNLYPYLTGREYWKWWGCCVGCPPSGSRRRSMPCWNSSRCIPIVIPQSRRTRRECGNAFS